MHDFSLHYSLRKSIFLLFHFTIGYFALYPYLLVTFIDLIGLDIWLTNGTIDIVYSLLMLIASIYLTRDLLIRSINVLAEHPLKTFKVILTTFSFMLFSSFVLNYVITYLSGLGDSANQSYIIDLFKDYPYLIIIQALVYAPIVEEIMFRGLIFGSLAKKSIPLAMFVSSLLFGLAHVYESLLSGNFADLWFIPTYAMLGYFLNRAYLKSGTIVSSMALHFMNNALGLLAIVVVGMF